MDMKIHKIIRPTQQIIGLCLLIVLSVSVRAEIPAEILQKAEQGDVNFQYSLGRIYEIGKREKSDRNKAIEWYTKAADAGHLEASYRLAFLYYRARGAKQDLSRAYKYMRIAAEGNHKRAQTYLSQMYNKGLGVTKDTQKSNYWYAQSFNTQLQPFDQYLASLTTKTVVTAAVPEVVAEPEEKQAVTSQKHVQVKETLPELSKHLLMFKWRQDGKPTMFLQSRETVCKDKGEKISCTSSKHNGMHKTGVYKYKVKSIIEDAGDENEFDISYRRMITAVPPPMIDAYDENAAVSQEVAALTIGWEKHTHTIPCKVMSLKSILCRPVGEDAFYLKAE